MFLNNKVDENSNFQHFDCYFQAPIQKILIHVQPAKQQLKPWCVINTDLVTNLEQHHMSSCEENQLYPSENQYICIQVFCIIWSPNISLRIIYQDFRFFSLVAVIPIISSLYRVLLWDIFTEEHGTEDKAGLC